MTKFDITFRLSDGTTETITVEDPYEVGEYVTGIWAGGRRRICRVDEQTGLVRHDGGRKP